jgi:succinate dehydrogenase flavin-adding protein (antitoxin of CptAB toxin-antitoxin module)
MIEKNQIQYEAYIGLREVNRLVMAFVKHRFIVLEVESSQSQSLTAPNSVDFVKQA